MTYESFGYLKISEMHKELYKKLDDAIKDFQLSETMTIATGVKQNEEALAQIALTLKGFAPNIQKEYILKTEDFEEDDDDEQVVRGAVKKKTLGMQDVAVKEMGKPTEAVTATLNKRVAILTALTTCENIEKL